LAPVDLVIEAIKPHHFHDAAREHAAPGGEAAAVATDLPRRFRKRHLQLGLISPFEARDNIHARGGCLTLPLATRAAAGCGTPARLLAVAAGAFLALARLTVTAIHVGLVAVPLLIGRRHRRGGTVLELVEGKEGIEGIREGALFIIAFRKHLRQ